MADKRLAEQNQRWLRNLRREIAKLQEYVVEETIRCTRETPEVEWAAIEKEFDKVKATATYGRQQSEHSKKAA